MSAKRSSNVSVKLNHVSVSDVDEKDSRRCVVSTLELRCLHFEMVEHFTINGNQEQPGSPIRQKEYEIKKNVLTVLLAYMVGYIVLEI